MDSSKLARLIVALRSEVYEDQVLNEIDITTQYPDDLQIPEAGYNCLHLSVMKGDVQLMKKLLDEGADLIKQGSRNGYTPLRVFINSKSYNRDKKIHQLIGKLRKQQIVDVLLSEQIKRDNALNPKCFLGVSHLHIACMVDHSQAVELFLKAGESVDQVISANNSFFAGWGPLHIAVTYSSIATVKILFYYGADIHLRDALGKSPLHRLIKRQLDAMDNITMGKRAIVTSINREVKRLEMIICALLKTRKTNEVKFIDDAGISAFHVTCTLRNSFMTEDFLKEDIDVNKSLNNKLICWAGWTPLHFAACCSIETVKLLVQHGADMSIKNTKGDTPLDFCMKRYSPATIHSILSIKEEFREILLSDQLTKLLDLILAMDNCDELNTFLQNLSDMNVVVPHDSPIWPGYSIFHLAISMYERTQDPEDDTKQLSNPEIFPKQYTCMETEEKTYWKRIAVCLARRCSLATKDANGMTAVHLAFKLRKAKVVDKLLNYCRTNEADPDGLSFLHMACTVGKKNIVERFNNDIENPVKGHFKWLGEKNLSKVQANSTALHVAVAFNHREIVEYLLQKKANLYARDSLGFTPVHLSAFSQPIARLFLDEIANLREVVSENGLSHLHVAAFADDEAAVERLAKSGANVNVVSGTNVPSLGEINYHEQTPLHVAVKMENSKAVRALIEAGADIHAAGSRSKYNDTPLRGAMRTRPDEMSDEFAKTLRRDKQARGPIEACGVTLLHFACAVFDLKWAKKLLDRGADPNARICRDKNFECAWKGCTPLHLLLVRAHFAMKKLKNLMAMVRLLLGHGADVTLQDGQGRSPLLLAEELACEGNNEVECEKNDREGRGDKKSRKEKGKKKKMKSNVNKYLIADLLLKHQKSYAINPATCRGFSHFHYACKRNKVAIVRKFLKHGVDVNRATNLFVKSDRAGFTPLHFALDSQSFDVAELLLDHNADVKAKDFSGNTPLHVAARCNVDDVHLLETMLRMGADVRAKNSCNDTPLDLLVRSNFISSDELKFFFDRGCLIEFHEKDAYQGMIGLLLTNGKPDHREAILRLLFEYCNLYEQIKNGFNAIQSFVSLPPDPSNWTVDRYLGGILLFMDMGCDIDRQSCYGMTASLSATFHTNVQAVEALLLLGADINISYNECEKSPSFGSQSSTESDLQNNRLCTVLGAHMWKMKFMGLDFHKGAMKIAERFWWSGNIDIKLEERCKDELKKMAQMKISDKWTMDDFLSESKIVVEYQTLSLSQRRSIDEAFKPHVDLRKMFSEFCGLLMLQYRKAVYNVKLYWAVRDAIVSMLKLELPDECLKGMLKYFDREELKKLMGLDESVSGEV